MLRNVGFDVARYNVSQSESARLYRLLSHHSVDCVIDVGANNGGYGRFIRDAGYKGKIISFEPQSAAHQLLEKNCANDKAWIAAPRMALGAQDTEMVLNISENSASSSVMGMLPSHLEAALDSGYCGSELVSMRRLDSVLRDFISVDDFNIFLKIDTQGYERNVVLGASDCLNSVIGLQVELSIIPLYADQILYLDALKWFQSLGFSLWGIVPGFSNSVSGRLLQFDGIFFRDC